MSSSSGLRGLVCLLCLFAALTCGAPALGAEIDFWRQSPPRTEILSATLSIDTAAFTANRYVGANEVNSFELWDPDGVYAPANLSEALFGTSAYPAPAQVDQGELGTGFFSASIDPAFFPAMLDGPIGVTYSLTDTDDAMFAIDTIKITAVLASRETVEVTFHDGVPTPLSNNGFGIGLADGEPLPDPLPISIPIGATGTGFDETISSDVKYDPYGFPRVTPEPSTVATIVLCVVLARRRTA